MVIGFRSFPDGFSYVVLKGQQNAPEVVASDRLLLPKKTAWPKCLSWVRKQLAEIMEQHDVRSACIKTIEPMARRKSVERYQIEAIIQEYLSSVKGLDCCTRIKSQLKRDIKHFSEPARYLERILSNSETLEELNTSQYQEATLAAVSELSK